MQVKKVKKSVLWVCSLWCLFSLFTACSDTGIIGGPDEPVQGDEEKSGFVKVQVLDSLGGNSVEKMQVRLYNEKNLCIPVQVLKTGTDGVTGQFKVYENNSYQLQCGNGTSRAFSTFQGITTGDDGSVITLYSYNVGAMHHIDHDAVQITDVEYSANKITWQKMNEGFSLKGTEIAYIRVKARGTSGIEPNDIPGEPYGIGLAINSPVTYDNRLPGEYTHISIPGSDYFTSTAIFDVSSDITFQNGNNTINISVFDVANNRSELKLTGNVAVSSGSGDPVIGGVLARELIPVYKEYPVTFNLYYKGTVALRSKYPVRNENSALPEQRAFSFNGPNKVFGYAALQFMAVNGTGKPGGQIRGFELFRAEGENPADSDYQLIAAKNFSSLNGGLANMGIHSFNDYNENARIGTLYHYKVRVFNNTSSTPLVSLGSCRYIPNFQAYLLAPADYAKSSDTTPELSFTITNAQEMMSKAQKFTFTLSVREKALGSGDHFSTDYIYDIKTGQFFFKNAAGGYEITNSAVYSDGKISLDYNFYTPLLQGLTYEWDILDPVFVYVEKSASGSPEGICYSHGNNPGEGENAINGSFTLTIADDAVNR